MIPEDSGSGESYASSLPPQIPALTGGLERRYVFC